MPVSVLCGMAPAEVRAAVDGFSRRYVQDWDRWLLASPDCRPELFGQTLRAWRATRPRPMRRLRREAQHGPPYLDDLLAAAIPLLSVLADIDVRTIRARSAAQEHALGSLWTIFRQLSATGCASCVGITKAAMLLTDGRIGPAYDSVVRGRIAVKPPSSAGAWLGTEDEISLDIQGFEARWGPLTSVVSPRFERLGYGRLYDMVLGPR